MSAPSNTPPKKPGYTQIPDVILDEWLPVLSCSEWKVVSFIARKTYGWRKEADKLSTAQIAEGTGLSRSNVVKTCTALEQKGYLHCIPSDLPNGHPKAVNAYSLNTKGSIETVKTSDNPAVVTQDDNPLKASGYGALDTTTKAAETSSTRPKNGRVTSTKKRPVQNLDPSKNCTRTRPKNRPVVKGQPVQNLDPQQTGQTALQTAAMQAATLEAENTPVNARFAAAADAKNQTPETDSSKQESESLPGVDVLLLDWEKSDIDRLRKTDPAELVRRFRDQNPAFAERMEKKAATAHTSPNVLLARCIVEDWLPEVRTKRDAPKPSADPTKPHVDTVQNDPKLAAFAKRFAHLYGQAPTRPGVSQ